MAHRLGSICLSREHWAAYHAQVDNKADVPRQYATEEEVQGAGVLDIIDYLPGSPLERQVGFDVPWDWMRMCVYSMSGEVVCYKHGFLSFMWTD